ncbi:MAG TPA: TIGR01244 family sulfur transferase [Sphingomicrobium sp.]|nr:TIGR01244 family sulfur transferase [Sphingomicrobium sp.]
MTSARKIAGDLWVCGFIGPGALPALALQFGTLINNRPDGEEPGQPTSAELEDAARTLGLDFVHIPIVPGQASDEQVAAFAKALREKPGPKLAFCRTGTPSASLWALSNAGRNRTDDILSAAREAGYDLSALKPRLDERAAGG